MPIVTILLIPLLASAATLLVRRQRAMEYLHVAAAAAMFLAALYVGAGVLRDGSVRWADGFFYADPLGALVLALTAFAYLICAPYAVGYLRRDASDGVLSENGNGGETEARLRTYYALTPLFGFAMLLVPVSNNLGVMWVAVEGTALASIFLVTFYGRRTSLEAAWKYAILGGVGLSMALFGTVLAYYSAQRVIGGDSLGALNWSVLVQRASQFDPTVMRMAFIFALLGYGTKAGIAPMHTWKPDAYSEAPAPIAALMATGVLNCALYALARFYVLAARCLGPGFASHLLIWFGLLTVGIAVPFILVQRSYRRLLAYSTIENGGIMVLSLGFGGALGPLAMLLHMTFHSVTKPLLFFCAGNAQQHTGGDALRKNAGGLIHSLPISAPMLLLGTLAITGTPPFSLFQSEFLVLRAGFATGQLGASALFVTFMVAIFCGLFLHIAGMVFGPPGNLARGDGNRWSTLPVIGLAVIVVLMGFWLPSPVYALVNRAAGILAVGP